jgi:hypothetical protein
MADRPAPWTPAGRDDSELGLAARELTAAREMLKAAHTVPDQRERREALKVAVARLALASRAIDDVVDRHT